ncbi:MAG: hypothetical protein ACHP9T_15670 [Caulobacterales bacterium]|jgi:glycerol-3-phosphate acyltransferase PlsY
MTRETRAGGAWLMAAAAALGLIVSVVQFYRRGSGVDHTAGALLVIISTALLLAAALVLALARGGGWWRALLVVLSILGVLGTGAAAGFLHAWILLVLMVVALAAWLILTLSPGASKAHDRHARSAA